jgi:hypothetical protein
MLAKRLIALGVGGATTTYEYDWTGARVIQTGTFPNSPQPPIRRSAQTDTSSALLMSD